MDTSLRIPGQSKTIPVIENMGVTSVPRLLWFGVPSKKVVSVNTLYRFESAQGGFVLGEAEPWGG